jgi:aspartate aminotransferase-like enzyme
MAIPAGLAFAVASPEYLARAAKATNQGRYFDVADFEEFSAKHQTPTTPALCLLYALEAQLRSIALEGIERRWGRHGAMRRATESWVGQTRDKLGIEISVLAKEGIRSPTVTAVVLPAGIAPKAVVEAVAKRGFVIGGGHAPVAKTTFRIGHMGDHSLEGLSRCLAAVEDALQELSRTRPKT